MHIVDGHNHHAVFGVLCEDTEPRLEWTMENIEVFVNMKADDTALLSVEVMKNSTLMNTASSKGMPCVYFLDVLRAEIAYSRTFYQCYPVLFFEARLYEVRSDIESANFIPGARATLDNRYLRLFG